MALMGFNALLKGCDRGEFEKEWRRGEGLAGWGGRGEIVAGGAGGLAVWLPPLPFPFPLPFPLPLPLPRLEFEKVWP